MIRSILCAFLLLSSTALSVAETDAIDEKPAEFKVTGVGFFKSRFIQQQLYAIFDEPQNTFDATDIEDAALIVISYANGEGFLEAKTRAVITLPDGETLEVEWDKNMDIALQRDLEAKHIVFELLPGPRFYYDSFEANEIGSIDGDEVEAFFFSEPFFFQGENSKAFTPNGFTSGALNLELQLENLGYLDANVEREIISQDILTGAVSARVSIEEGPLHTLTEIVIQDTEGRSIQRDLDIPLGSPYSEFLRQDIIQALRNSYYDEGYAFVDIKHSVSIEPIDIKSAKVSLALEVTPGNQVRIGEIKFSGNQQVRTQLLEEQLSFEDGDLLDPRALEAARLNMAKLGLFQSIKYQLEGEDTETTHLTFQLQERSLWQVDALAGWGSYEKLRGGVIAERLNALGKGHLLQFKSILSQKSLQAEAGYVIPNFYKTEYPISTKAFYLNREERSFDRKELGIDIGTFRRIPSWEADLDLRYTFQRLQADNNELGSESITDDDVRAASIQTRITRNTRNNPLNPTSGYRVYGHFEWAAPELGGQVDYQSAELGFAYTKEIKRGLFWHGSFTHGVIGSFSESSSQIPTNKLFYPGGDNSIRGYQRGGAAPRDANGDFVGASSFALLNLELEQKLSGALSVVLFSDTLGVTNKINEYPFDEYLYSIGLGIRFRTFMGPLRLEYGRNLDPRPDDPNGTLHLTIGYPF